MATGTTMSGAQFDALPYEEGRKWELLEGELIEVPGGTPKHQLIAANLAFSLGAYFRERKSGAVFPDSEFSLGEDDRLRPDVAVLLLGRLKALDLNKTPIPGAPDIAAEVISPSERTIESMRKVGRYLNGGAPEVWQVYPETRSVMVYREAGYVKDLSESEELQTPLLPGWSLALAELFDCSR